jgi:hypothetical protein
VDFLMNYFREGGSALDGITWHLWVFHFP